MTEKKAENKGDIRMITLTEKDADSVIRLLKEMQEYRKKDFEQEDERFQGEVLLLTAGFEAEKEKEE